MKKLTVALACTAIAVAVGVTTASAARKFALSKNTEALTGTVVSSPVSVTGLILPTR
jgi:ABC-type spermidine/putrescine transport system permease subunit II